MKRRSTMGRAIAAALGVVVCLGSGCASKVPRSAAMPGDDNAPLLSTRTPTPFALTPEDDRRAQAVARYASGWSQEWLSGLDAALPEYVKSIELNPGYTELGLHVARIYLDRKDYTKAASLLEEAIKANPDSLDARLWLGITYVANDQPQKAIPVLRQNLKLNPAHIDSLRELLKIYVQQGPPAEVVALLDHAWRQPSKEPFYWVSAGDLYMYAIKQKPSLAGPVDRGRIRQCYEKALALSPNNPEILWRLAAAYLETNDFKAAADVFAKLLAARPDAPQVRERLAVTYIQAGEKEKATAVLEEIIKRNPLRFETYNALGDLYDDLDKDDKATSNYQQSLVLNPNQLEVYVRLVLVQMKVKKYEDAIQTLAKAKEKYPAEYQIPYLHGLIYNDLGQTAAAGDKTRQYELALASFADAETLMQDASEEAKPSSSFYFAYGSACERAGKTDKAVTLFKKAIDLDPKNHAALNYLGYMWADQGVQLDEGLVLIQKAIALEPNSGAYVDSLGWVLYKMGRYEEALTQLRRAVELVKDDSVVCDHLAEVLMKLGRREEAIQFWRRAHELEPDNKAITEKLNRYDGSHTSAK